MHHVLPIKKRPPLIALLALVAISAPFSLAQETTAGIQGTIKDQSGAMVAGAEVEVASPALLGAKKVTSDGSGNYRFAALPPGQYTITVTAKGFRTFKE